MHPPEPSGQRTLPLDGAAGSPWPAPLKHRLAAGADAGQIARAVAAVWLDIDLALHPIRGHRGVAVLYHRSLNLGARQHLRLQSAVPKVDTDLDPGPLQAALAQRPSTDAAAAAAALFESFHSLLATLVGPTLTIRLLLAVWDAPTRAVPAQDPRHE